MKRLLVAGAALLIASSAQASTINFTDAFVEITPSGIANNPLVAQEVVDGVTFTITALSSGGTTRLAQSYSGGVPISGIRMGIPGNGTSSFKIEADQDVEFDNLISTGPTSTALTIPIIEILLDGATTVSSNNSFSAGPGTTAFNSGPLALDVGHYFVFSLTNNSVLTGGSLDGIDFTKVSAPQVPLPAGLPLILSAFGALAAGRIARKRNATTA